MSSGFTSDLARPIAVAGIDIAKALNRIADALFAIEKQLQARCPIYPVAPGKSNDT